MVGRVRSVKRSKGRSSARLLMSRLGRDRPATATMLNMTTAATLAWFRCSCQSVRSSPLCCYFFTGAVPCELCFALIQSLRSGRLLQSHSPKPCSPSHSPKPYSPWIPSLPITGPRMADITPCIIDLVGSDGQISLTSL